MIQVVGPFNSGVAAGGAGSATANADTPRPIAGKVLALYLKYNDSPPATTDVTIATKGTSPAAPAQTILSLANANADGWFYPRAQVHLNTSGAAIAATYNDGIPVHDLINVLIAQANAADSVDVWLMVEC